MTVQLSSKSYAPPGFACVVEGDDDPVIALTGELCMASAPIVRDALWDVLEAGHGRINLDLSGVTFMDSQGIHLLLDVQRLLVDVEGGRLTLLSPSGAVMRVLGIAHLVEAMCVESAAADVDEPRY